MDEAQYILLVCGKDQQERLYQAFTFTVSPFCLFTGGTLREAVKHLKVTAALLQNWSR